MKLLHDGCQHDLCFGGRLRIAASLVEEVVQLTRTVFFSYWKRNGIIHENIFDEVFDGVSDIDTLGDRTGKPLNEMATNR